MRKCPSLDVKAWERLCVAIRAITMRNDWRERTDLDVLAALIGDLRDDSYEPSWNVGLVRRHLPFRYAVSFDEEY